MAGRTYGFLADLLDDDLEVREGGAKTLGEQSDVSAVQLLIAAVKELQSEGQTKAFEALGNLGDTRAVEPLVSTRHSTDAETRRIAVEALGRLGYQRAVKPLITAIKRHESMVLGEALAKLGDRRAVKLLIAELKHSDGVVRARAAFTLEKLSRQRAVQPQSSAIQDDHDSPEAREMATQALGILGHRWVVDPQGFFGLLTTRWSRPEIQPDLPRVGL